MEKQEADDLQTLLTIKFLAKQIKKSNKVNEKDISEYGKLIRKIENMKEK